MVKKQHGYHKRYDVFQHSYICVHSTLDDLQFSLKVSPREGRSCALVDYRISLINKNASMTRCTVILLLGFFYYFRAFFPTRGIAQTDMYTRNVCYYYCLRALCWLHCRELSCPTSITPTTCCFSTTMLQFCRKAVEKFG